MPKPQTNKCRDSKSRENKTTQGALLSSSQHGRTYETSCLHTDLKPPCAMTSTGDPNESCVFFAKIDYQNKAQAVPLKRSEVRIGLDFVGKRCMQVYSRVVGYDRVGLTAGEAKFGISFVLKLVLATTSMSFHKKTVTLSFWLYGLFTSSIQLCFVSFRGPLPYPNWLSSQWSMPCQRHGKRVGWNLSHCWATAYPGELWVFLLAKSHSEKSLSLLSIRRLPCFYDTMRAMRDGDNFFPSRLCKWNLEEPHSKTLIGQKNQKNRRLHRLQLGFFVLLTFNHLERRSPGGWIHGRSGGWNHVLGRCFAAGGQARKMRRISYVLLGLTIKRKRRVDDCLVWKFSWVQRRKHKWEDFWNIEWRVQSFSWIFRWFPCWWRVLTPHCQLMIIECLSSPSAWDFHHFGSHVHA